MWPIATDVARSICVVSVLGIWASSAKTSELIDMMFGGLLIGPRYQVSDGAPDQPWEGAL